MTFTALITLNAVLGSGLAYALHHLLAHGIRSDRASHPVHCHEAVHTSRESERLAA